MSSEKLETGLPCDCGAEVHDDEHDADCAIWETSETSQKEAAELTFNVSARMKQPGVSEVQAKNESFEFDSSPKMGDQLPGPAELLCGAFAACLLKNVERFSELLPFEQRGASVTVTAERQQTPPEFVRIDYCLELITDEPQGRIDLLMRNLAKHGTVYNTLAKSLEINGEVVTVPTDQDE